MQKKNKIVEMPEADKIKYRLSELTSLIGISSKEGDVSSYLNDILTDLCDNVTTDKSGNVIGRIYSRDENAKTIILEAHMDRVGLMVSGINEDGYIKFTNVGGMDERVLLFSEVVICGKKCIPGIIFSDNSNTEKNPKIEDMLIDTGFTAEFVKDNIYVGDLICVKSELSSLCGTVASAAAMDNRAGIVCILDAIGKIDRSKLKFNIDILFAVQEELGLHGAYTGVNSLDADAAIVIDVTHGSTPDVKDMTGVFKLGSGAVICRGPNFHCSYTNQLINLAEKISVPYEIEVASGPSGTDAWAIQINGNGVPSMLISIPLRYMHTNVETLDLRDVITISELIVAALEGGITLA